MTFTESDVCKVFVQHGAIALPSSPCFVGHARRANKEAEYMGAQAGWDYIYWAARVESSKSEADLLGPARRCALQP
jgi:hypothetical protein